MNLSKQTKLKGLSQFIAYRLYYDAEQSPLRKSYRNSIYCQDVINIHQGVAHSLYCKNRWCPICNRIKTAELMNEYLPTLEKQPNLVFLTLTRPNVKADALAKEIKDIKNILRIILNDKTMRKALKDNNVIGLHKLECTYNHQRDDFHPHFHILLSDASVAKMILARWMKKNPSADKKAQSLKPVDALQGGAQELFKYFTKLLGKDSKGRIYFDAPHMDVIFRACKGVRIYGTIGNIEAIKPTKEAKTNAIDPNLPSGAFKYRALKDFIGYYPIHGTESAEPLICLVKPTYLRELEEV